VADPRVTTPLPRRRSSRGVAYLAIGAVFLAATALGGVFFLLNRASATAFERTSIVTTVQTRTVVTTTIVPAPTRARPIVSHPKTVGVPFRYTGRFTSVDRLERCVINETFVRCTAAPSADGVRLSVGSGVRRLGHRGSADLGGPSMPEGTSFNTPAGSIRCSSSSRGVTCTDTASGDAFTIGDYRIVVESATAAPTDSSAAAFASIDRKERCRSTPDYVECVAQPSQKAVKLQVGVGASYEGLGDVTDRGGPALSFGSSRTVAGGAIRCQSSTRGITCNHAGAGFTIGDYIVVVSNGGITRRY
jgi:hypothetical protein